MGHTPVVPSNSKFRLKRDGSVEILDGLPVFANAMLSHATVDISKGELRVETYHNGVVGDGKF